MQADLLPTARTLRHDARKRERANLTVGLQNAQRSGIREHSHPAKEASQCLFKRPLDLSGHVALVTGANHGIGAATAVRLAANAARVLITYLRIDDAPDPGTPESYRQARASDGGDVVDAIEKAGGTARAMELDLAEDQSPGLLFDTAEAELGPVDILVNNASGWVADSFGGPRIDRLGRNTAGLSAATSIGCLGGCARQCAAHRRDGAATHRTWGNVGKNRRAHLRWTTRLSRGGVVRRGEGCVGELHDERGV